MMCAQSTNSNTKAHCIKDNGIFPNESGYLYQTNSVIPEYDDYGFFAGTFRQLDGFTLKVLIPKENRTITSTVPVKHPYYIKSHRFGRRISLYNAENFEIIIEGGQGRY